MTGISGKIIEDSVNVRKKSDVSSAVAFKVSKNTEVWVVGGSGDWFKINSDGRVSDVKIISGVCPDLDNEVIRVLSSSPKFKPAIKDGKPVAVAYTFPVIFALR